MEPTLSPGTDKIDGKYYKIGSKRHKKALQDEARDNDNRPKKRPRKAVQKAFAGQITGGRKLGGSATSSRLLNMEGATSVSSADPMPAADPFPSFYQPVVPATSTTTHRAFPHELKRPELDYDDLNPLIELSDESQAAGEPESQADDCVIVADSLLGDDAMDDGGV